MKVVQIITRMDEPGGAQIHVRDLCLNLNSRGHDISLISGSENQIFPEIEDNAIPYFQVKSMARNIKPIADIRALFEMKKIISRLKPDLLAIHSSKAGMIGRAAGWMLGIPTVFTAHGWAFTEGVPRKRKNIYVQVERIAGRLSSGIIAVSQYDYALALNNKIITEEKLEVIQNGVPDRPDIELAKTEVHPPRMVMVARFAEPKNHRVVINALNKLRNYEWEISFVGDGPLKDEIERYVGELGLAGKIKFLGSSSNVSSILASAQLFILATNWEGLPLSILEAMRAGLPIVASDVGGVKEAVDHTQTGFLVKKGEVEELAGYIEKLIRSPELRFKMGTASRARYTEKFTFERMINETEQFYQKIIDAQFKKVGGVKSK
ncbi:glycosyltransferase family 4 protein [Bacillus sp. ISL-39]|uniref:glycosyltransferase family 4 protein n=1 Tax=Bacillus sp. ISL-39 TaxID=2819124 RepID=UPI001BE4E63F|nr:glycosyltransferase family 4 protein [Bacillus sp. ISL-39]MBT2639683.1 glycosyltransferase family 4 protein [Bacillus sp. ISL-39]